MLDLSPVSDIDYTAGQVLLTLLRDLRTRSVAVHLAHVEDIHDLLQRYGVLALVGIDHVHHGVRDAVAAAAGTAPGLRPRPEPGAARVWNGVRRSRSAGGDGVASSDRSEDLERLHEVEDAVDDRPREQ